ncbi:hypothetical protein L486_03235 [Kwoniella mangroviensis CBS 10435]|uniref:Uncharacterized protein n=1 Tax=Kwoniella mangroviensis CBS 10435 TaxID=1331196 RepID=A0A1B9IT86_9TREE|nr:hypothetical protein L486_03235 [Kwoniella mangroviensis CBS 10435]
MMSMDRDRLSIDTFTSVIERDTVYSRASNVATILRSLGSSTSEREQGINALCGYIEGKKGKGKNEEEIRKKLNVLESMVSADLGEIFVKASLRSGLARKSTHPPPPFIPVRPTHRSRLSLASLSSIRSSSQSPLPPVPPIKPAEESPRPENSPITYTSPSFTFSFSPVSSSSSFATESGSISISNFGYNPSTSSITPSSSSSAPPLTSSSSPHTSIPFTPYSPFARAHTLTSSSTSSASSLGRAPTLLSPLAIGGWGRSWERPLLRSNDDDRRSSSRQKMVFDGISLKNFPNPPDHIPSPSSPGPDEAGKIDTRSEKHIFTREFLDSNRISRFFHVDIDDTTHDLSPTKSTSHTLDQSWLSLSISDVDDKSSVGLPSAGLPDSTPTSTSSETGSGAFEWDRIIQSQSAMGVGMGLDDERTVTGIESSRWSAVISNVEQIASSQDRSELDKGPTEASLLRDAYLSMINTPPLIKIPGPEQGDSHTILMAYAQPAAA